MHDLFVEKVRVYGEDASLPGWANMIDGDGLNIHSDYLRIAGFEALEAAGCHYRLCSPVTGVVMQDNLVRAVSVTTKTGTQVFTADATVDATGDGDVAYHTGAEVVSRWEEEGPSMPVSLIFALANVDGDRFSAFVSEHREALNTAIDAAADAGYAVAAWYSFNRGTVPGVLGVNNGALRDIGNLDGTQAQDLTVAERAGIQVAADFVRPAHDKSDVATRLREMGVRV